MKTEQKDTAPPEREIADLLPWYAAGTLESADAVRVEAALAGNGDLRRQLAIIREEMDETVLSNQRLAGASPRALDALFAAIDKEPARAKPFSAGLLDLGGRLATWLQPKTLAWAGIAAALVIAVQAGFLIDFARKNQGSVYETASAPQDAAAKAGTILMVGFQAQASAGAIESLLGSIGANIIEGPRAGLYRLRVGPAGMTQAEIDKALAVLRGKPELVRFAAQGR